MRLLLSLIFLCFHSNFCSAAMTLLVDTEGPDGKVYTDKVLTLIQDVADQAEKDVRAYFPNLEKEIFLELTTGKYVIPETGEVGAAIDVNRIRWTVDPNRAERVDKIISQHLRGTLFHEFHHLARGWARMAVEPPIRIIDAAISEGLSVVFQRDYAGTGMGGLEPPENIDAWVDEVLMLKDSARYEEWMFQHSDGRRLIGYRVGVYLVDRAIKASKKSVVDLVRTPTDQIVAYAKSYTPE